VIKPSKVELQFIEHRKFSRVEICALFRLPRQILGYTEDATRNAAGHRPALRKRKGGA
jgi:hypothetical protein